MGKTRKLFLGGKQMKKLFAILMALVMVLSFAACGQDDEPSVYWLNFKPESDEALKEIAALYTAETGIPVEIVTAASGTYSETLTSEMDKANAPTIFVVSPNGVPTWGDYCLDLTGTAIANELSTDAYNVYDGDKLVSIGYCYECYGIIVNNALLNKAGHDVSEITNFETLKAVVEDITANKDSLGFSAFTSAGMDGSSSWRYTGHLINLEYVHEFRDNPEAWGNGAYGPAELTGAYMDNFKALYDLMVENSTTDRKELATGGFDAAAEFANGEAAFYCNGNWEYQGLLDKGMNAEDLYMIPYYSGVEGEEKAGLNCGTENYWAINSKASKADIDATMDFLVWLVTDAEASEMAVTTFGVMPYKSAAESTNRFLAQANAYLADGCYNFAWVTNFQPNVDAYRETAVNAMNAYNADPSDANWATVVTAFIDGWAVQYAAANG